MPSPRSDSYRSLWLLSEVLTAALIYQLGFRAVRGFIEAERAARGTMLQWLYLSSPLDWIQLTLNLTVTAGFCLLLHRAACNARSFGAVLSIGPHMAGLSLLIPALNLGWPLAAMKEIWQASAPPSQTGSDGRSTKISPLVALWWMSFLVSVQANMVGWSAIAFLGLTDPKPALLVGVTLGLLDLFSTFFAIAMVRGLAQRQEARHKAG